MKKYHFLWITVLLAMIGMTFPNKLSIEKYEVADKPVTGGKFNILLLGIDSRDEENSRSDVIMLINVDRRAREFKVLSIPRDTRVNLPNAGFTKINHAHLLGELAGGTKMGSQEALEAVRQLCGCIITYYLKIDFQGFENSIDLIGGIEIDLPSPVELTYSKTTIPAGLQHLNGHETLKLVRERHSLAGGDFARQNHQYLVLKAILRKVLAPENLKQLPSLLDKAKQEVIDTNLNKSEIISLSRLLIGAAEEDFLYLQLPGQGKYLPDELLKRNLYYWDPDMLKLQEIAERYLY